MDDDSGGDRVASVWQANRAHLVDLAFGMLGDIGGAEDAVQEAFTRLSRADLDTIEDPVGWLTVVTGRICLDHIRSARSRRERPFEPAALDGTGPPPGPGPAVDPADRITLDDEVRIALLVVLQRLSPAERVAFVLHDVFQVPFAGVATTMNRPVATCRQLAKRARAKVQSVGSLPHQPDTTGQRELVARFIEACSGGDIGALLPLLDPQVWGDIDLGPGDPRTGRTAHGARRVAGNLLRYFGSGPTLVSHPGLPGVVLAFVEGELNSVIAFISIERDVIKQVHVIADPDRMGFLNADLAAWSGRAGGGED